MANLEKLKAAYDACAAAFDAAWDTALAAGYDDCEDAYEAAYRSHRAYLAAAGAYEAELKRTGDN